MQKLSDLDINNWPNGIIGFLDLRLGKDIENALILMMKNKNFKGIRFPLALANDKRL
jgi:hypothetical protein